VTQTNWCKNHAPANGAIRAKGKSHAKKSRQQSHAAANASAKESNPRGKGKKRAHSAMQRASTNQASANGKKITRKIDTLHKKYDDVSESSNLVLVN